MERMAADLRFRIKRPNAKHRPERQGRPECRTGSLLSESGECGLAAQFVGGDNHGGAPDGP